ncbi:MAG: PhzF family phenazine biosynthesis protein [Myxococcales bacterium]|nr:PhzF family phenazine biosynthesis protein [Myxococcales bacterium]
MQRRFSQVDVFSSSPYWGNPVAIVHDGLGLSDDSLQRFAHWTNLSETTFLLPPSHPDADYRVRIFTPGNELPFAGHPTIGTCHAWLEAGGTPKMDGMVTQECGVGLVKLRQTSNRLAFAAPPLIRSGPVAEADIQKACRFLRIERDQVMDAQWADNGPGWMVVMLESAAAVLDVEPDTTAPEASGVGIVGPARVGVVGLRKPSMGDDANREVKVEVRAFFRAAGAVKEDPVTGSLNAALAQWLLRSGQLSAPYVASQGTALGRSGRVYIDEDDGQIWVGGHAVTCVSGTVEL